VSSVIGAVVSIIVGGAVAVVTVIGLVDAQTGASGASPANVNQPVVDYGATS
jgi:hypothetical protein